MEQILFFRASTAISKIRRLRVTSDFVDQWYHDKQVSCYILNVDDKPVSFVLLSTMDFDPLKKHSNPKTLNFVYTFEEHRRKGYAEKLIKHVKTLVQFSAFCSNEASEKLFAKSGCTNHGDVNNTTMFRYP